MTAWLALSVADTGTSVSVSVRLELTTGSKVPRLLSRIPSAERRRASSRRRLGSFSKVSRTASARLNPSGRGRSWALRGAERQSDSARSTQKRR
jgi:hypothetical protein